MTDPQLQQEAAIRLDGDVAALGAMRDDWEQDGRAALDEMVVAAWIVRAQQHLVLRIETLLQPLGLTMTKFECLVVLLSSRNGALGMNKMAERLGVHPTSITYAVDALMSAGLVERRPHPRDRRRKLAALTADGRDTVTRALAILERDRFGVQSLGAERLRQLTALIQDAITPEISAARRSHPDAEHAGQAVALPLLGHRTRPVSG